MLHAPCLSRFFISDLHFEFLSFLCCFFLGVLFDDDDDDDNGNEEKKGKWGILKIE